jgi:hypothetical protein
MTPDEEFAATLDAARKCNVQIVQDRTGKVKYHERTGDPRLRGQRVDSFTIDRRVNAIARNNADD